MFDRFLARLVDKMGDAVTLKGGLALELRLERARTTRDVDLRVIGSPDGILEVLRSAARRDLDDFMVFAVGPDEKHPEIQGDGMKCDGAIAQTFSFRDTHGVPRQLPAPPRTWEQPYAALARTDGLRWTTLEDVTTAARSFLNPVLASEGELRWEPATWTWAPPATTP